MRPAAGAWQAVSMLPPSSCRVTTTIRCSTTRNSSRPRSAMSSERSLSMMRWRGRLVLSLLRRSMRSIFFMPASWRCTVRSTSCRSDPRSLSSTAIASIPMFPLPTRRANRDKSVFSPSEMVVSLCLISVSSRATESTKPLPRPVSLPRLSVTIIWMSSMSNILSMDGRKTKAIPHASTGWPSATMASHPSIARRLIFLATYSQLCLRISNKPSLGVLNQPPCLSSSP